MTPFDYWASGAGLGNITPAGKPWPEGESFGPFLEGIAGERMVLEFGCGVGRLATCFDPLRYRGVDVCPQAIKQARKYRLYRFDLVGVDDVLPVAHVTLAHTVLLHVPDDEIARTIGRFTSPGVIVSEILGRHWRRAGDPPVFNREREDYVALFAAAGYGLHRVVERPYPHYRDTNLTVMEFRRHVQ